MAAEPNDDAAFVHVTPAAATSKTIGLGLLALGSSMVTRKDLPPTFSR